MDIIFILPTAILSFGLFNILTNLLNLQSREFLQALKIFDKKTKSIKEFIREFKNDICLQIANTIKKFIRLDKDKKESLERSLKVANINKTPESYIAYAFAEAIFVFSLLFILGLIIEPFLILIGIVLASIFYFKNINLAKEKIKKKKENIEKELCRFVSTVEQELKNHRDVIKIFENFKKSVNENFKSEIDELLADMRLNSYEKALRRFEIRINSTMLSEVVRGLISTVNGDDNSDYFRILSFRFKEFELNRLEKEAEKIPNKVSKFSAIMTVSLIFILAVMLFVVFKENMKEIT